MQDPCSREAAPFLPSRSAGYRMNTEVTSTVTGLYPYPMHDLGEKSGLALPRPRGRPFSAAAPTCPPLARAGLLPRPAAPLGGVSFSVRIEVKGVTNDA